MGFVLVGFFWVIVFLCFFCFLGGGILVCLFYVFLVVGGLCLLLFLGLGVYPGLGVRLMVLSLIFVGFFWLFGDLFAIFLFFLDRWRVLV